MAFVDGGLTVIGGFLGKGQALSKGIKKKKKDSGAIEPKC